MSVGVAPVVGGGRPATMGAMPLLPADLARLFGGRLEGDGAQTPIAAVAFDSRRVVPGGAFIALRGEAEDGHRYVGAAARAGASLAVVRRDFAAAEGEAAPPLLLRVDDTASTLRAACRRRLDELGCAVVGVTGSVGKTTAKELCAVALGRLRTARTPGNLNTWTGIPTSVLGLEPPVDVLVAELAMTAPGEIRDLARMLQPRIGVLLNVGLSHIELLGSVEAIADAKAELLEALPADGVAVCNANDERVRGVTSRSAAPVVWFGLRSEDAVFTATDLRVEGLRGTRFRLVGPGGEVVEARLEVPGEHVVLDACAAAAVAAQFGVGLAEVAERLATFRAPEQRGRVLPGPCGAVIYDDSYNSSPASLAAALAVLGSSGAAVRVAVIGDMLELGDYADEAHREAGRLAAGAATALVSVGPHADVVAAAAREAGMAADAAHVVGDAGEAAAVARRLCGPDTAVLVKASHGMALERVIAELTA